MVSMDHNSNCFHMLPTDWGTSPKRCRLLQSYGNQVNTVPTVVYMADGVSKRFAFYFVSTERGFVFNENLL